MQPKSGAPKLEQKRSIEWYTRHLSIESNNKIVHPVHPLKVMISAIHRQVREKCGYSTLKDMPYGKATELQREGKGKQPNPLTSEEEDLLWSDVLEKKNPTSLKPN